ncbi:hypothetical protein TBLA_0J01190 [Henningerozyma blattae CBS 6284]|uniref:Alpha-1,2-mannosyltransferase MNN2 n=1 Tax=Henningerozyma blattae (strain ATCC 34711 / CBS 6284 / DSM 70876 / NBRC 10599 / NRRL Y-10934 / UCD 77-7) TaxID=1071380 RepID=I2H9R4_HENB6|nr:hypothetical protein TBLA_0J01190 [Tetrapisispora blattae CBS 6284]CCH63116.1 hypothetical protein TBLA_0J01190 [Tetrapisispora blattae CBS 6284]
MIKVRNVFIKLKYKKIFLGIIFILSIIYVQLHDTFSIYDNLPQIIINNSVIPKSNSNRADDSIYSFYKFLFQHIKESPLNDYKNNPLILDQLNDQCLLQNDITFDATSKEQLSTVSYNNLKNCYSLQEHDFKKISKSQLEYINKCVTKLSKKKKSYTDILFPKGRGIVTVGGGKYSLLAYLMIKLLREKGTTLPVEVVIPPSDKEMYDDTWLCNDVLPTLNAKCIYFTDRLPAEILQDLDIHGFQYKSLAIWISSFKKTLFLDSDNFPLKDLDNVFDTPAFEEVGLIFWPDLWRRTIPPDFYDISNIKYDLKKRVRYVQDDLSSVPLYDKDNSVKDYEYNIPFHDLDGTISDPSTETGQMLVDKETHFETLLLSIFFNYFGFAIYYDMFSQAGAGIGDKDTFIAAAHVLGQPYYQVKTPPEFDGFWHPTMGFQGLALLQHDFNQDYKNYQVARIEAKGDDAKYENYITDYNLKKHFEEDMMDINNIDVMFAHYSLHKAEPMSLLEGQLYFDQNGKPLKGLYKNDKYGMNLEYYIFNTLHEFLCPSPEDKEFQREANDKNTNINTRLSISATNTTQQLGFYRGQVNTNNWDFMCVFLRTRTRFLHSSKKKKSKSKFL